MMDADEEHFGRNLPGGIVFHGSDAQMLTSLFPFDFKVDRGGIKFPTPQKETNMATTDQRKTRLKQQMVALKQQLEDVQKSLDSLERPPMPPVSEGRDFMVRVQFTPGGASYEYLIKYNRGRWYTTGSKDNVYQSWDELLDWLESTWSHSAMWRVNVNYQAPVMESGGRCER